MEVIGSMPSPPTGTRSTIFLQTLENATAPQHTQLEQQELMQAIMQPGVTNNQYLCYLLLMGQVEKTFEKEVLPKINYVFDRELSGASAAIDDDIAHVSVNVQTIPAAGKFSLPDADMSVAFALGFTYVMQGSKLGGKVIYKHINKILGYSDTAGASYLNGHGADTGPQWKNFVTKFSNFVTENDIEDETIAGAQFTFNTINTFLQNNRDLYAV